MAQANVELERWKREAAEAAVELVQPGMVVGMGHGSTARYALLKLAKLWQTREIRDIRVIPCSRAVEKEAQALGLPLATLEDHPEVDLTIDGADEIDPKLNVIKGGGGALLREKIVAQATRREVIVADFTKLSPALGTRFPVPVEVLPFGWRSQAQFLEGLGAKVVLRVEANGVPHLTDHGNYILDCWFGPIRDPWALAAKIGSRAGILGHGLFLGLVHEALVAGPQGLQRLTP